MVDFVDREELRLHFLELTQRVVLQFRNPRLVITGQSTHRSSSANKLRVVGIDSICIETIGHSDVSKPQPTDDRE
jgi:hypothetical protein